MFTKSVLNIYYLDVSVMSFSGRLSSFNLGSNIYSLILVTLHSIVSHKTETASIDILI